MKIASILKKVNNKKKVRKFLKRFRGNFYYSNRVTKPKNVLIYLKNPEFFHLGDCLFLNL